MESAKRRIRLIVAYDGTNYHGWQIQNNAVTIESELNAALLQLTGEAILVAGASRTDAGVHAKCNMAIFDTTSKMPADKFAYALNAILPQDIRIQNSTEVPCDWHPRKINTKKTYEYRIYRGKFDMPIGRQYNLFVYRKLDIEAMRQAAAYLIGEHDFKSFCQAGSQAENTVRTLYQVEIIEDGHTLIIRVCGNGFLYNMVRIIVGTLLEVGIGNRLPESIPDLIKRCDRTYAGPTAIAQGLMLVDYEIEGEGRLSSLYDF